jgi:hypothetical protein
VPPLLVAVEAMQAGLTPMPADEPEIVRKVDELRRSVAMIGGAMPEHVEWAGFGRALLARDGSVRDAWMYDDPTYEEFVSWLTIATAYRDADYAEFVQQEADHIDQMLVRPAIPLAG